MKDLGKSINILPCIDTLTIKLSDLQENANIKCYV